MAQVRVVLPEPKQLGVWAFLLPLGQWQVLAHLYLPGATRKKRRWLGQSQRLERQPGAQAGLTVEVHLHEASVSKLGEGAVLFNAQKPRQRMKKKEEVRNILYTNRFHLLTI